MSLNTTSLSFGNLTTGQTSSQQGINLTNIGSTTTTDITIEGTHWIMNSTSNFTSNYTKWSTTSGFAYASGTSVTTSPASMEFNLANNASQATYYRVQIPLGVAKEPTNRT